MAISNMAIYGQGGAFGAAGTHRARLYAAAPAWPVRARLAGHV